MSLNFSPHWISKVAPYLQAPISTQVKPGSSHCTDNIAYTVSSFNWSTSLLFNTSCHPECAHLQNTHLLSVALKAPVLNTNTTHPVMRIYAHDSSPGIVVPTQQTHDAMITSLLRQNDVVISFWCDNDIIVSCVRWEATRLCTGAIHTTLS